MKFNVFLHIVTEIKETKVQISWQRTCSSSSKMECSLNLTKCKTKIYKTYIKKWEVDCLQQKENTPWITKGKWFYSATVTTDWRTCSTISEKRNSPLCPNDRHPHIPRLLTVTWSKLSFWFTLLLWTLNCRATKIIAKGEQTTLVISRSLPEKEQGKRKQLCRRLYPQILFKSCNLFKWSSDRYSLATIIFIWFSFALS